MNRAFTGDVSNYETLKKYLQIGREIAVLNVEQGGVVNLKLGPKMKKVVHHHPDIIRMFDNINLD